ncbi:MAG: DUF4826 family protein [Gammaproteobacteria bacterium]|nr:DUF4826 family protein [Gammaproteobacteria bacterium]
MATKPAVSMEAGIKLDINWSNLSTWEAEQLSAILDYCQQRNWQAFKISEHQSRTLEPLISIWKVAFSVNGKPKTVWFINGELPIDFIPFKLNESARDALLSFSRKFLKQAQILKQESKEESENRFLMQKLVKVAADLLVLYHEKQLWKDGS